VWSGYGPYGMMGDGSGWGSMGWMMIFGGALWLLLLVLAVVAIVWVVRSAWAGAGPGAAPRNEHRAALEILHERYARGEIEREEYLRKKADLLRHGTQQ